MKKFIFIIWMVSLVSIIGIQAQDRPVFFMDLDFQTIDQLGKSGGTVIVPMAQIEAHGPHLPVGTDYYITKEIAKRAAEKSGAIVGPPILLGNCIDFASWPGYMVVDNKTFIDMVKNYCRSIDEQRFQTLVFIVQHGGNNVNGIRLAVEEYHREHPKMTIHVTTTGMLLGKQAAQFRKPNFHMDTAIMLDIRPDLVHMERVPDSLDVKSFARIAYTFQRGESLADLAPEALFYKPTASNKEDGAKILDIVVRNVMKLIGVEGNK